MCSETYFTQEKVNFHATTGIPNSSSYCCCPPDDHLQEAGPSFWQLRKGHEKCIFETPHNEIKCVFWVSKNQISMKKRIKIFTFAYCKGRGGCPPPPYGQPDRKISVFFDGFPKHPNKKKFLSEQFFKIHLHIFYIMYCVIYKTFYCKEWWLLWSGFVPLVAA